MARKVEQALPFVAALIVALLGGVCLRGASRQQPPRRAGQVVAPIGELPAAWSVARAAAWAAGVPVADAGVADAGMPDAADLAAGAPAPAPAGRHEEPSSAAGPFPTSPGLALHPLPRAPPARA